MKTPILVKRAVPGSEKQKKARPRKIDRKTELLESSKILHKLGIYVRKRLYLNRGR